MNTTQLYDTLAKLLAYPAAGISSQMIACRQMLGEHMPEAAASLDRFAQQVSSLMTEDLQELYTQTFDLNPICSLELGWQLYGENYSRGEFLVEMRGTLRRLDVPESTELPDHITHVLPAFGRMPAREADRFATGFLLPALEKMLQGLSGKNCPYVDVLEAIRCVVLSPYGAAIPSPSASDGPPSPSIGHGVELKEVHHG